MPVSLSVCLFVCLSDYLSVCLFVSQSASLPFADLYYKDFEKEHLASYTILYFKIRSTDKRSTVIKSYTLLCKNYHIFTLFLFRSFTVNVFFLFNCLKYFFLSQIIIILNLENCPKNHSLLQAHMIFLSSFSMAFGHWLPLQRWA